MQVSRPQVNKGIIVTSVRLKPIGLDTGWNKYPALLDQRCALITKCLMTMKKTFIAYIIIILFLSACGTLEISLATPVPESPIEPLAPPNPESKLSLESSSEEIQKAMLESTTKWKSIWMDGTITQYAPEGGDAPLVVSREQVWIDLTTSRFRILTGPADGAAEKFKASDGMTILELD